MPIGGAGLADYAQTTENRVVLLTAFPGNDTGLVARYEAVTEQLRILEDGNTFRIAENNDLRVTEG